MASLLAVVLPVVAIGARIGAESGSAVAGVGAAGGMVVFLGVVIVVVRKRAADQLDRIEESGVVEIDAGLDFECLPDDWPIKARETLNPAGAANTPFLPVRLSVTDRQLRISKKRSWGCGRQPFEADVELTGVAGVEVQPPELAPLGSTLLTISVHTDAPEMGGCRSGVA